jgi:twitching motility two-component system response regulator PilH
VNEGLPQLGDAGSANAQPSVRPRVLVVDDEDLVRLVLLRTLRLSGFDVFEASDGIEALARLPKVAPDIVLTDLNMPRCNGEQLCLEIKRHPATAGIPVVIMTGGPLDEARMRQLGCAAVIYKPWPDRLPEFLFGIVRDTAQARGPDSWARVGDVYPAPTARGAA